MIPMTRQSLEILLERVASWPQGALEELVQAITEIETKHLGVYKLSADERGGRAPRS
jgi:hypothetical protein